MLAAWSGLSVDEFRATAMGRAPIAQPATTSAARALLDWDVLDRVLRAQPDVLVVARGRLIAAPAAAHGRRAARILRGRRGPVCPARRAH